MDTDIIRNQKLGAGAGMRSNKVRVCVCLFVCGVAEQIALWGNIAFLLEAKSIANHYIIPEPVCGIQAKTTEAHRSVCFDGAWNEVCRDAVRSLVPLSEFYISIDATV